jgi:ABC transporter with metal-binding/Fe-S-binding domain ATP-binding protein
MRLAALFSGGKDSTFALYCAQKAGHTIECLITIHPSSDDSLLFHYPNSHITKYLAEAMEIPLLEVPIKIHQASKEDEKEALDSAIGRAVMAYPSIQGVVHGGIASAFQGQIFKDVCKKHSLESISPLWGADPEKYMEGLIANKFAVMIVGVSAMGLEQDWLGKVIDEKSLARLVLLSKKYGFNLTFEGGEAESLVVDCPLYLKKKLVVKKAQAHWDGQRGIFEILEAELAV